MVSHKAWETTLLTVLYLTSLLAEAMHTKNINYLHTMGLAVCGEDMPFEMQWARATSAQHFTLMYLLGLLVLWW